MTTTDRPILRSVALGGSLLSRAIQSGTAPTEWHMRRPEGVAAWRAHVDQVRAPGVDWLAPISAAFGPNMHTAGRRRLADAARDGVVVTTGQQPGLFGGPAYTLTKALSALALADELSAQLRLPVAPVFWAATDDTDWHEAAATHVVGDNGLEKLSLPGPATDGVAMADVPLDARDVMHELRAALRAAAGSAADPLPLDLIDAAYVEGETIGSAYVTWLRSMLEPLGIAVVDASHSALRTAADPFLRSSLRRAGAVASALDQREREIVGLDFTPQVEQVSGLSLVFETSHGTRSRVPLAEASARADSAVPGSLGANVLLRPILERSLLPTVCYVAGPGELGYFAQVTAAAGALEVAKPVAVPRWGMSWCEPQTSRLLERLDSTAEDLQVPHVLEGKLARAAMDRDVSDALERLRGTIDAQVAALGSAVSTDRALVDDSVMVGLSRDLVHRVERIERRLLAAVKRRETGTARDIAVARAALHPLGSSPERVLSLIPTLARFGLGLLDEMRGLAREHARALVSGSSASSA